MKTALRLSDYEDMLDPKEIHSLIAITAFYNKFFKQCSKAFIRLERLETLSAEEREVTATALHPQHVCLQPLPPASFLLSLFRSEIRRFGCDHFHPKRAQGPWHP